METHELVALTRTDCIGLLAANGIGRLSLSMPDGTPVIRPVNYGFDERSQSIILRTARGSKLYGLLHSAKAAFEIDRFDTDLRTGWSVVVLGSAEDVKNPVEIRQLERLGVEPWAAGEKPHWIRIRVLTITGRQIVRAEPPVAAPLD